MSIGKRIQALRKTAGLTQKELGQKMGVSASMIGQYENNLRIPKFETIKRISDALGATPDFILGLTDSPDTRMATQVNIDRFEEKEPPEGWGYSEEKTETIQKLRLMPSYYRNYIKITIDYFSDLSIEQKNK